MACSESCGIVHAVDADHAGFRFVEAADQIHNGRFAAAGRSYQRNRFAASHFEREILQDRIIRLIVEVHMLELDVAANRIRLDRAGRSCTSGSESISEKIRSAEAIVRCISA